MSSSSSSALRCLSASSWAFFACLPAARAEACLPPGPAAFEGLGAAAAFPSLSAASCKGVQLCCKTLYMQRMSVP